MKIRLLKPLIVVLALYLLPIGIISAVLTSPVYADETADTRTHSLDINGHKIKLILDSEDLVHEATSAPSISDDHVFNLNVSRRGRDICPGWNLEQTRRH